MTLCSNGHDEVCYESGTCPACNLVREIDDLKYEVKKEELRADKAVARFYNHICNTGGDDEKA